LLRVSMQMALKVITVLECHNRILEIDLRCELFGALNR